MIYLKENKINKFGNNKIYLKDKVIYQAVKGDIKPIKPFYLKKGFDYNSFTENGIVDAFNNEIITQYESYVYSSNDFVKNTENKSVEITFTEDNLHSTGNNNNYLFDEFKSILFKCENMSNAIQFTFFDGSIDDVMGALDITISFKTKSIIYGEDVFLFYTLSEEQRNSIVYIYVDFNLTDSQSTIKFLDSNFETVFEETTDSILLNNWRNSESPIDFRGGVGKKINFSYLLYCDKPLSIDEIKEIDKYMMNR